MDRNLHVVEDEGIIRGVKLVGNPCLFVSDIMYDVPNATDKGIYRRIKDLSIEEMKSSEVFRDASEVLFGPYQDFINIYEDGIMKSIFVSAQAFARNGYQGIMVSGKPGFGYNGHVNFSKMLDVADGIAGVRGFVASVSIDEVFGDGVEDSSGDLNHPEKKIRKRNREWFEEYFRDQVEEAASYLSDTKGHVIRGVIFEDIGKLVEDSKILDIQEDEKTTTIQFEEGACGLFLLAATYLI